MSEPGGGVEEAAELLARRCVERMLEHDAFSRWLGLRVTAVRPDHVAVEMTVRDEMLVGESGVKLANTLRASGDDRLIFLLTAGDNPDPGLLTTQSILFRRKPANLEELANTIRKLGSL